MYRPLVSDMKHTEISRIYLVALVLVGNSSAVKMQTWGQWYKTFYRHKLQLSSSVLPLASIFQIILMFVGKARSLPQSGALERCFTQVGSGFTCKHQTWLEKLARDKTLQLSHNIGPWSCIHNHFLRNLMGAVSLSVCHQLLFPCQCILLPQLIGSIYKL